MEKKVWINYPEQIPRGLVYAVGGFTLGFGLYSEYGRIVGGIIGFLAPFLLWK